MKVGVSFISSDYDLETTISKIDESNADYIHVDMMDGNFVEAVLMQHDYDFKGFNSFEEYYMSDAVLRTKQYYSMCLKLEFVNNKFISDSQEYEKINNLFICFSPQILQIH